MDDEEHALLKAIIAHPDEDTPRLVYADWLQEHDQPERAEYIRLSIQLANLRYGDQNFKADEQRLLAQRRPLIERSYDKWQQEIVSHFPANRDLWFGFRRGMVEQVRCSVKYFLDNAEQIFRAAPIRVLQPTALSATSAKRLTSSAWFRCLGGLHIFNRDPALALLDNTAPEIGTLRFSAAPDFRFYGVSQGATYWEPLAVQLAAHPDLKSVKRIDLECSGIGNGGGEALAHSRHLEPDVLNLLGNPLDEPVRQALRKRYGSRVWLDLADCNGFPREW